MNKTIETAATDAKPVVTNWPTRLYIAALLFGVLSLAISTLSQDGPGMRLARSTTQLGIAFILLIRLWVAHQRREQNRMGYVYIVFMLLAVPLWLLMETYLFAIARMYLDQGSIFG